jgi:enoyl-CoA hydratase/carnithine racemase
MTMQKIKAAINRAFTVDLASELEEEAQAQAECLENPYTKELIKAFLEER